MKRSIYLLPLLLIVPLFLFRSHLISLIRLPTRSYPAAEASKEVGSYVTLIGRVAEVSMSSHGTVFIDFSAPYPHQSFTAVVFARKLQRFAGLTGYRGLRVAVTGRVDLYHGKPEIVLRSQNQLKIEN